MIVKPKLKHTHKSHDFVDHHSLLDRLKCTFSSFCFVQYEIWHRMEKETKKNCSLWFVCIKNWREREWETKKTKNETKMKENGKNGMTMKENSPLYWNSLCTNQIYTMYKLYTLSCVKRKKTGVMFKTATSLPIFVLVIHNTFAVAFVRTWAYTHHFNILRIHATNYLCDTDGIDRHHHRLPIRNTNADKHTNTCFDWKNEGKREKGTNTPEWVGYTQWQKDRESNTQAQALIQTRAHTHHLVFYHLTLNTGRINTFKSFQYTTIWIAQSGSFVQRRNYT